MTDVVKGVSKTWDRLFDHKGFLSGEISFLLREFEQKRKDEEVDNLFKAIEGITDIKDTEIDRFKQTANQLEKINENLDTALDLCAKFSNLEERYKDDTALDLVRKERKVEWDTFMDGITSKYSDINSTYELKEAEVVKTYEDIERKILV